MQQLIESGRIADVILAIIMLELVGLLVLRHMLKRGPKLLDVIGTLLSGVFLIAALRSGITGAHWTITASFLLAALLSHVFDIWRRWTTG
jgi:hypothetical protein